MDVPKDKIVKCEVDDIGDVFDVHGIKIEEHPIEIELKQEINECDSEQTYSVNLNKIPFSRTESSNCNLNLQLCNFTHMSTFHCCLCGKYLSTKGNLVRHQKIHTREKTKPYSNGDSHSFFLNSHSVKHQKTNTSENPYQCHQCDRYFIYKNNLTKHKIEKCGLKLKDLHQCSTCNKHFTKWHILRKHQITHTGEKPFQCSQCDKPFAQKCNLEEHKRRIHTGEKPYQCSQCEKCFAHKSQMKTHQRKHTGEKPYQCNQCNRCFSKKYNLEQHQLLHTGDRPYKCNKCDECFIRKETLITHQRKHSKEKLC